MGPVSASLSVFVLLGSAKGGEFNKKRAMEMGLGIVCLFFKSQILSLTSYQGVSNHDCLVLSILSSHHHIFSRKGYEGLLLLACNYGFVFLKTTIKQAFPERGTFFPLHWGRGVCTEGVQNSSLRFKHKYQVVRTADSETWGLFCCSHMCFACLFLSAAVLQGQQTFNPGRGLWGKGEGHRFQTQAQSRGGAGCFEGKGFAPSVNLDNYCNIVSRWTLAAGKTSADQGPGRIRAHSRQFLRVGVSFENEPFAGRPGSQTQKTIARDGGKVIRKISSDQEVVDERME